MTRTRFARCAAVTGGFAIFSTAAQPHAMDGHQHGHAPASANAHDYRHGAIQAGLSIQPQSGERVALAFTLSSVSGEPIESGQARVYFTFPRAGRYLVAADVMTEAGPYAEQFVVEVAGEKPDLQMEAAPAVAVVEAEEGDRYTAAVVLDGGDTARGYQVSLARPDRIEAGEPATFTFRVARSGVPVTDLRPSLDAPLHLAVVKQDFGAFLHEHAKIAGEAQVGHEAHASHEDSHGSRHDAQAYQAPATFEPELTATFSFPYSGWYQLFAQAAHGDSLLIARFPLEVH